MTPTSPKAAAMLLAVAPILAAGAAAAGEAKPKPNQRLCAEYLRDLQTYRPAAEQLGCQILEQQADASSRDANGFPPVVTDPPATDSSVYPPVEGEEQSGGKTNFPPVEQSSTPAPKDMPPVESDSSSSHKSSSSSGSGSTSSSHKRHKRVSEDPDIAERHWHHDGRHHAAKEALKRFLREHGGFISNFSRSRGD